MFMFWHQDDDAAIKSLLIRLTGRSTFPNVILRGKSLGGYDSLKLLHDTGALEHELQRAGVKVTGSIRGDWTSGESEPSKAK